MLNETQLYVPSLTLVPGTGISDPGGISERSPLPPEMLDLFAELTGWVIGFEENRSSYRDRQIEGNANKEPVGKFFIEDMSADWPAQTPTAHRGRCDRFVKYLDSLVSELQRTKRKLKKAQSKLATYEESLRRDIEVELVDCFLPSYRNPDSTDFTLAPSYSKLAARESNEEKLPLVRAFYPPFDGWRLDGAPGFVNGRYIDWKRSESGEIDLIVGKILSLEQITGDLEECLRSEFGDCFATGSGLGEAKLTVDPVTKEFRISGDENRFNFYVVDFRNENLVRLTGKEIYHPLKRHQCLVISTSGDLEQEVAAKAPANFYRDSSPFAVRLQSVIGAEQRVLVLQRV